MKKLLALILALVMCIGCVAILGSCGKKTDGDGAETGTGDAAGEKVIKIGIFEPASGDNAAGGKQEVLGIRYAHSVKPTVTVAGVEYKVELFEVDNQTTSEKAPTAATALVTEKVSVVLGSYGSGASMAGGEIFEEAKIPAIGCSCTNPGVTTDGDYYFRVCYIDPFQGSVMANFAKDSGCNTAYVLTELGDDYSTGLGNYFVMAAKKLGMEVAEAQFPAGTTDFNSYIANAKNYDCIFAPTSTTVAALFLEQAATAEYNGKLMAGDTWESSVILDAAKGTDLDVTVSTFFDENDEGAADFVNAYKAWLNADSARLENNGGNDIVAAVSALGYDSYMTAVKAIEAATSTDTVAIRDALAAINTAEGAHMGVTGAIYFDEIGDAVRDIAYIKKAVDGAFQFVKIQEMAD